MSPTRSVARHVRMVLTALLASMAEVVAETDFDIMCPQMKAVYQKCACQENPTSTVGYVMPSAFIGCIRLEIQVAANFTGTNQYLSKMLITESGNGERETYLEYDVNNTVTTCEVTSQQKPCDCTVCQADGGVDGLNIDCNSIPGGGAASTNGTCSSLETLFQYQFERPPDTSGATSDLRVRWLTVIAAFTAAAVLY